MGYSSKCISETFDCRKPLIFQCGCEHKRTFEAVYTRYLTGKKIKCDICSNNSRSLSFEDIKNNLLSKGFILLTPEEEYKGVTLTPLICKDKDGYKSVIVYNQIMRGGKVELFHRCNPFSLYNVHLYLKNNQMPFECISDVFIDCQHALEFKCKRCGNKVEQIWRNINRNFSDGSQGKLACSNCDETYESTHASVLKQMFLHEYPDTIVEDRSYINPDTKCARPTDIVNHRLKLAIEIQSQWHDFADVTERDRLKKEYWINRGYTFYSPDIRDYTILEMCQLFFDIEELPSYINYALNKKLNLLEIQNRLNAGQGVTEIASQLNIKPHRIYDAIYNKKLSYPENYHSSCFVAVEQYNFEWNLLNTYISIAQAARANGIREKTLTTALSRGLKCGGFYWKYVNKNIVENA